MSTSKERIKQILRDCCAGNASLATDILHEEFVIIAKADLPAVKRSESDEHSYHTDGDNVVFTSEENARMWVMRDLAVWQFLVNEETGKACRRDEIARELVNDGTYAYRFADDPLKLAIDRIIELEASK